MKSQRPSATWTSPPPRTGCGTPCSRRSDLPHQSHLPAGRAGTAGRHPVLAASLALTVAVFLQQQVQHPATDSRVADHVMPASSAELDDSIQPGDLSESAETALAFSAVAESSPAQPEATRSLSPLETDTMRLSSDAPDGLSTRLFPNGSQPVPGETRSLLVQQGDIPVVVNYTVVDVEKAAGQMRVFLSGNGIHHIVTTTPPEKPDDTGNEIENAPDARYVALLVDAPQDPGRCGTERL